MNKEGILNGIPRDAVMTDKGTVETDLLIEDHKNLVYHLIQRIVRDRTAHEDIFQEVFMNVLESLPRFEGRSKLSTWIASITVHTCYKFIQKAGKRERVESFGNWLEEVPEPGVRHSQPTNRHPKRGVRGLNPGVPTDIQNNLEKKDVRHRLEQHIGELAPKYSLPITLFYLEEMSYQEIAEVLEIPMGTVKSHLFRGLRELRKRIKGGEDEFLLG